MTVRLLTGVTGVLGSAVAEQFLEQNDDSKLILLARDLNSRKTARRRVEEALYKHDLEKRGVEVVRGGSLSDENLGINRGDLEMILDEVDEFWMLAADTNMSRANIIRVGEANIVGVARQLDIARKLKKRKLAVYVSTGYVAGDRSGIVKENELYVGQGLYNYYEFSKLVGEQMMQDFMQEGNAVIIYRPTMVVGNSQTWEAFNYRDGILGVWKVGDIYVRWYEAGEKEGDGYIPFNIVANPNALLNLILRDLCAKAMVEISKDKNNFGKVFHLANPQNATVGVVGEQFLNFGVRVKYVDCLPENVSLAERKFYEATEPIHPYMKRTSSLFFDMTNTLEALGEGYKMPNPSEIVRESFKKGYEVKWKSPNRR